MHEWTRGPFPDLTKSLGFRNMFLSVIDADDSWVSQFKVKIPYATIFGHKSIVTTWKLKKLGQKYRKDGLFQKWNVFLSLTDANDSWVN